MSKSMHLQVFTADDQHIGHFDGEAFYTSPPVHLRVDGDEVYNFDMPAAYVGTFQDGKIRTLDGTLLYYMAE